MGEGFLSLFQSPTIPEIPTPDQAFLKDWETVQNDWKSIGFDGWD